MTIRDYIEGIKQGSNRILSKAITLAESQREDHYELALQILEAFPNTGRSRRIGITGTPGAGKSTFINTFGQHLLRNDPNCKIAVLSIDPSSSISGGSILGDKTRMGDLSKSERVYIRPSASGTHYGGLARSTRLAILLCEAAGYDYILVESVGVGQGETEISQLTDLFLLILNPGGGDELQGIKRGIVEMADILVVNKADEDRLQIARQTAKDYQSAQTLMPETESGWKPKVVMCSSLNGNGLEEVDEVIREYFKHIEPDHLHSNRYNQQKYWVFRILEDQFRQQLKKRDLHVDESLNSGQLPERLAQQWSKKFFH